MRILCYLLSPLVLLLIVSVIYAEGCVKKPEPGLALGLLLFAGTMRIIYPFVLVVLAIVLAPMAFARWRRNLRLED